MLHAAPLGFRHPVTNVALEWTAAAARGLRRGVRIAGRVQWRPLTATSASALGAIVEAIRSGYGDDAQRAQDLPDSGYDPAFVERTAPLLEFLWSRYFRVRLLGIENVPDEGAALLVGNHSGGIPYDGAMLLHGIRRDHPRHRHVRPLIANFAFRSGWMANVVARVGCVRASMETALPMLARGELVAVFPEGLKGVGKLYRERYRLARFGRGGFVRLAREAQVPLLPVAVVGAEEIHPGDRKDYALRRTARHPVYTDNSYISLVGSARACCPFRRSGRSRSARRSRRRRPATKAGRRASPRAFAARSTA